MRLVPSSKIPGPIAVLQQLPESWAAAVAIAALALVFVVDLNTGATPFQHLYYVPIMFAAVSFGVGGGLVMAGSAIALYHVANPHLLTFRYGQSDIVQVALFLAVALVTARLVDDARRLHALAMTDDLTGLHNLRSFQARLLEMIRNSRPSGAPMSMMVVDVDRLKAINDRYGHLAGAEAVQLVGGILGAGVPADAVACRYGGDEFAVALPGRTAEQVAEIADRLCQSVAAVEPTLAGVAFPASTLSISVGLASREFEAGTSSDIELGEELFRAADEALYRAKHAGRNQFSII
jgi:diguanylate cyclase (GGDEF)-like protein